MAKVEIKRIVMDMVDENCYIIYILSDYIVIGKDI